MSSRGTKYWDSGAIPLIAPEILGDIISEVADLGIVISDAGIVLSVLVNPTTDSLARMDHLEGTDLRESLTSESVVKFDARLEQFLAKEANVRPIELNHCDNIGSWEFPVRYSFHRIGPDGAILMLGSDLRPIAEMQQQLVKAQLALERDYETQREYDTRFRVLMDTTTDALVFVSVQSGEITELNAPAATILADTRDAIIGSKLSDRLDSRKRGELVDQLASQAISDRVANIKMLLRNSGKSILLCPKLFRVAGERVLLCRLIGTNDEPSKVGDLAHNLQDLYAASPDAIVFASDAGNVLSANEAFLDLIDVAHDISLRGRSLSDYLLRGSVDLKVMIENASRSGRMRMYATKIAGNYGSPRNVEISITRLQAGDQQIFAFVLRDANHADAGRSMANPASDESMRSVAELVGSATLKDIVAETTNVVEKMCIETAVELTMNNRVAAAEMLGLSRQSLYVKLRKFDLLNRDDDRED